MSAPNLRAPVGVREEAPAGALTTGRVSTAGRVGVDPAAVRAAAVEIFQNHRRRALELSIENTPLGAELRRLFERERSIGGQR